MNNYNKLLEKAREAYKNCVTGAEKRRWETIFPELKESEDEKMIRLIKTALCTKSIGLADYYSRHNITEEEIFAWLEKQGERKSVWSEDDERRFDNLIRLVENSSEGEGETTKQGFIEFINRIKSSEQQCLKPTEE